MTLKFKLILRSRVIAVCSMTVLSSALFVVSSLRADEEITVLKTRYKQPWSEKVQEVFLRSGKTNMIRVTAFEGTNMVSRLHRFLVSDKKIAMFWEHRGTSSFTVLEVGGYMSNIEFGVSNQVTMVSISTDGGSLIEAYSCTNGLFQPIATARLKKANEFGTEILEVFEEVKKPDGKFLEAVDEFVEKHRDK
jgi:hypothetical protein